MFLAGRGAGGAARAVSALSCALLLVTLCAGAAAASNTRVVPADGRLNTANYTATVTSVAWPATNAGAEPTPGRRFVRFTLEVSAPGRSASPTSLAPDLSAALRWDNASHALSLSSIDDQLQGGSGSSASASYVASVPTNTHQVDLVLSQGSFSQSFDLWTLRRVPPAPSVLYRGPDGATLSGGAEGPAMLTLSNPADGFTNSATVTLQSAALGYFAPSGTTLSPGPDQGVLSVVLEAEFPDNPDDPTGSGHYLGSTTPLPANLLSFTPSGGTAVAATMSDAGDTTGKGTSDDGLFDATYSFVVPASLTTGSLEVGAGSFSGAEFTLYTAESGSTTLDVSAPTTLALSFPAPVAPASQSRPPWVGQPDPPTSAASTSANSSSASASQDAGGSAHSGGFPIWAAIVILLVAAALAVLVERWRRKHRLALASATTPGSGVVAPASPAPAARVVPGYVPTPVPEAAAASESEHDTGGPGISVLGPEEVLGLRRPLEPRVLELFRYLAFHHHRHLRAGQILIGMWPSGSKRADLTEKTIRNYLGDLRGALGVTHLPEAKAKEGYILLDVPTDWDRFEALAREADVVGGTAAERLRDQALRLVRGVPFCDCTDEWIGTEGTATHMSEVIAKVALRQAQDRYLVGDFAGAKDAARRGLLGAPEDYALREAGALSIGAQGDTTALGRWMADAVHHLEPTELVRLEATLRALHDDPPQSDSPQS